MRDRAPRPESLFRVRLPPFITDPEHLAQVEGQRYLVLRPSGDVVDAFSEVQRELRRELTADLASFPNHPHVTLRGWPAGTPLDRILDLAAEWAAEQPTHRIEIEGMETFPPPFQVVFVAVRDNSVLRAGYAKLARTAKAKDLPLWPDWTADPAAWRFHMSAAYCAALDHDRWQAIRDIAESLPLPSATCTVAGVEVVAFDQGEERSVGTFSFQGSA